MNDKAKIAGLKAALADLIEFCEWSDMAIGVVIRDFEIRNGYKPPYTVAERERMKMAMGVAKEVILW